MDKNTNPGVRGSNSVHYSTESGNEDSECSGETIESVMAQEEYFITVQNVLAHPLESPTIIELAYLHPLFSLGETKEVVAELVELSLLKRDEWELTFGELHQQSTHSDSCWFERVGYQEADIIPLVSLTDEAKAGCERQGFFGRKNILEKLWHVTEKDGILAVIGRERAILEESSWEKA